MRRRSTLVVSLLLVVGVVALVVSGCGGSAKVANGVSSTTAAATPRQNGALAFARCLRSHGIPNWPDPTSSGAFDKSKLRQLGISASRVRAIEEGPCSNLLPSGPQTPTITPAERTDYLHAAACMRAHGFPGFPDPTFPDGHVRTNIPSSIDQDAARFRSAATVCTRLIPAGLPYSSSGRS